MYHLIKVLCFIILICCVIMIGCTTVYYDYFARTPGFGGTREELKDLSIVIETESNANEKPSDSLMYTIIRIYVEGDRGLEEKEILKSFRISSPQINRFDSKGLLPIKIISSDIFCRNWSCNKIYSLGESFYSSSVDSIAISFTSSYEVKNEQYEQKVDYVLYRHVGKKRIFGGALLID